MGPIGINEHLAHLMQVQGGLLDAYLEQNLGTRYAYAIFVWEPGAPARVRGVTNCDPRDVRAAQRYLQEVADARAHASHVVALDRSPLFIDATADPQPEVD